MRINEITNWAYGFTVLLTALSGAAFMLSANSANQERIAVEQHLALDGLAKHLALVAEERTDEARLYVIRGHERHFEAFAAKENEERNLEHTIERIKEFGASDEELRVLQSVGAAADALDSTEQAAVAAYRRNDVSGARQLLFGPEHERLQALLLGQVEQFSTLTNARTGQALEVARIRSDWLGLAAKVMLALTAALFLGVLYFILKRRISMPLTRMTGIVRRLANQDYTVDVPIDRRQDEIGDMHQAIQIFRTNGIERDRMDAERRQDQQTKDLILQMMHRLQACQNRQELADIVSRFAPQIFPNLAGHLYVMNDGRTSLFRIGTWLEPQHCSETFAPDACWALRRGHAHISNSAHDDIPCHHLDNHVTAGLCVPLMAQGDTIGLLYFEEREGHQGVNEASRLYLELIAENIGLATANLQLRERLTSLATSDALTGLLNRRSLDEALNHLARDNRDEAVACLMIDIDHFKRFNDNYGHDAGDVVMQHVGQIMRDTVGKAGKVFRFGGEEFTVLLPQATEAQGLELAERLREQIAATPFSHRGRILGSVTISVGAASSPQDGPVTTLVTRADAALFRAKSGGRNRTVAASVYSPAA
ncbi:diguanylate cyclase [Metarhizobium album]|uniref:diguanylate cyclase n=1 Tax=Metarhizobium album TaxID=2182425 RepID=A0A2U2DL88_9HYPH|nr:diguanylate cyclase [Rhizobium album]PWE54064.1 diguanylate cyclase [Rhizobium album]